MKKRRDSIFHFDPGGGGVGFTTSEPPNGRRGPLFNLAWSWGPSSQVILTARQSSADGVKLPQQQLAKQTAELSEGSEAKMGAKECLSWHFAKKTKDRREL